MGPITTVVAVHLALLATSGSGDAVKEYLEKKLPPRDKVYEKPLRKTPGADHVGSNVNVSNLAGQEAEVSIDINPLNSDNLVIAGHNPGLTDLHTFYTTDGGETWTLVSLGTPDDGLNSDHRFDPTVAFDANGVVYVGYGAITVGNDSSAVVVCTSLDGGASYSRCTSVVVDTVLHDKWHLATGPSVLPGQQRVYLAWTYNPFEDTVLDQRIVVSRSDDEGISFTPPMVVNDGSQGAGKDKAVFADPAVGPSGEVYVSWYDWGSYEVYVDASLDEGVTWGTDVAVGNTTFNGPGDTWEIPAQPDREIRPGPVLDADRSGGLYDGRLYLTYTDQGSSAHDTNVYLHVSSDGGVTWSGPILVNDDGGTNSQFLPWVDVDQVSGWVNLVWYDARNDVNNEKVEVHGGISTDGGASFLDNVRIALGKSDQSTSNSNRYYGNYLEYIGTAAWDGVGHAAWADNSSDPSDLDFFSDRYYPMTTECGTCDETTTNVRATREFRNNCAGTSVADGFECTIYTTESANVVHGARFRDALPFTTGQCQLGGDDISADAVIDGGLVAVGESITLEATMCQDRHNEVHWRDVRFTSGGSTVCDVPASGFSVGAPNDIGGGEYTHNIEISNASLGSLQIRNLEAVADFSYVSDLGTMSFSGPTHAVLVGSIPDSISAGLTEVYPFQTTGHYVGGYVYLTYEISNRPNPTLPEHWDRVTGQHVVLAPAPTVIPTLSEWALVVLMLLMLSAGIALLHRRHQHA